MSTLNQRLYVSVYSSFKFKYIFNIISTYIVNVESTLNQQIRARWERDSEVSPKSYICICIPLCCSSDTLKNRASHVKLLTPKNRLSHVSVLIKGSVQTPILYKNIMLINVKMGIKEQTTVLQQDFIYLPA